MKFYVTTPIYYASGMPHIGSAYTTVAADILARWHRLKGEDVFLLVGTDEHGEKVAQAAEKEGVSPKEFVDKIADAYKSAWDGLGISYDYFIRTTDESHMATVSRFIKVLLERSDVYKGEYEGWYCTPDETFWTELQLVDGKCPECGRDVKKVREESYFFRLSAFQDRLLEFYRENPGFLAPHYRAEEIINRVRGGLNDVSISRTSVRWAVPFPDDERHFVYVWVDALINYISAIGWPDGRFGELWPADVHLVGKEINWFHSVIWPAMLMSAGIGMPKTVFAHGWWTVNGQKMSKSRGNQIDPLEISQKYSVDALRYFMVREMPFGSDGDFSEKALVAVINGELVADLGNLFYRVLSLVEKGPVEIKGLPELEGALDLDKINGNMERIELHEALEGIWNFIRSANRYVNEKMVWKLDGEERGNALYNLLEACRIIGILVGPFMPQTSAMIAEQLGTGNGTLADCKFRDFAGHPKKGTMLFRKIEK